MSFVKERLYPSNPATTRGVATKIDAHGDKIVYTNGRTVIIRDLTDPSRIVSYSGHVSPATVARISPSGYYCASADQSGTVRVWDIVGEDQVLKNEVKAIAGRLNDLAWDGESKRIIAVGDGRERFGHAFVMDTGSSTGEISGHSKVINAVSIRHQRPFRAATASDDNTIVFYQGVPYKYDRSIRTHTRFVQDVKFSPSGDIFASVGSDGKAFLYDGKIGDTLGELPEAHKGSAMAVSWSPDNHSLITSSADCTVKLWDVETRKPVTTWSLGSGVDHQQVGNTWAGAESLVSLSMSGDLNIFDKRTGDRPSRILYGSQKGITAFSLSRDQTLYAGSYDGRAWTYSSSGGASPLKGTGHTSQIVALSSSGEQIFSTGFDDHVREIDPSTASYTSSSTATGSQPRGLAASSQTVFVVTSGAIEVVELGKKISALEVKFNPTAVNATANGLIAVGGEDNKVHLFDWDGSSLKESSNSILEGNKGQITSLAFSPDGSLLVVGDSAGKIVLFDVPGRKSITNRWTSHTARINSLSWTPNGKHIASGSLDTNIYIWSVEKQSRSIALKNVTAGGVSAVSWLDEQTVAGSGADACVRTFKITFH